MDVFINDEQDKVSVPSEMEGLIKEIATLVLESEGKDTDYEVSVTFVDDERIRELNRIYREKDQATDVLSFPLLEEEAIEELEDKLGEEIVPLLGDIVISVETAQRQAEELGHSLKRELAYLVVHSMFHLLNYDHMNEEDKRVMRGKEKEIIKIIKIFRD